MTNYVFAVEGLDAIKSIEDVPEAILVAARQAVNRTTERARTAAAREMRLQVNFPARYLSGSDGRLQITKRAQGRSLSGVVTGRHRATSLARFVSGSATPGKRGVRVQVKPGSARFLKGAFLIKLRAGAVGLDTAFNLGLAVRTKNGQKPSTAYKPLPIGKNLWLLFGPSVDQVFRTVAGDIAPEMAEFMDAEFKRLLELKR